MATIYDIYPGDIDMCYIIKDEVKKAAGYPYHKIPEPKKLQTSDFDFLIKSLSNKKGENN